MFNNINVAIEIEKLHRYVFDNIYVQNKEEGKHDPLILTIYKELKSLYPTFRQDLYDLDNKKYTRYRYK